MVLCHVDAMYDRGGFLGGTDGAVDGAVQCRKDDVHQISIGEVAQ